jgi:WD40 repeat protein
MRYKPPMIVAKIPNLLVLLTLITLTTWLSPLKVIADPYQPVRYIDLPSRVFDSINDLEFHPTRNDLLAFVNSASGKICLWNLIGDHSVWCTTVEADPHALQFSNSGSLVIVFGGAEAFALDANTGKVISHIKDTDKILYQALVSHNEQTIVTSNTKAEIKVWDVETGELIQTIENLSHQLPDFPNRWPYSARHMSLHEDGRTLAIYGNGMYSVIDLLSGKITLNKPIVGLWGDEFAMTKNMRYFAISGTDVHTGDQTQDIAVYDTETGERIKLLKGHQDFLTSLSFSADQTKLISSSRDGSIRIWDVLTGDFETVKMDNTRYAEGAYSSYDGTFLITTNMVHKFQLWKLLQK